MTLQGVSARETSPYGEERAVRIILGCFLVKNKIFTCTVLLKLSERTSICVCEPSSSRVGVVPPGGDCVSAREQEAGAAMGRCSAT